MNPPSAMLPQSYKKGYVIWIAFFMKMLLKPFGKTYITFLVERRYIVYKERMIIINKYFSISNKFNLLMI